MLSIEVCLTLCRFCIFLVEVRKKTILPTNTHIKSLKPKKNPELYFSGWNT